jgi:CHASE3 domain sensor protein
MNPEKLPTPNPGPNALITATALFLAMGATVLWTVLSFRSFLRGSETSQKVSHTYPVREAVQAVIDTLTDAESGQLAG